MHEPLRGDGQLESYLIIPTSKLLQFIKSERFPYCSVRRRAGGLMVFDRDTYSVQEGEEQEG